MSVTQRFRRAVADRDAGAVAVVVAVMSVLLFGVAALVIDIGQAYAKRRAAQTDADLAAFAGAAALPNAVAAFDLAYDYLQKNLPSSAAGGFTLAAKTSSVWTDSNPTNGEITISNANTRIRVVVPNRKVDFGFANALPGGGFKNTNIRASATVEIRSPSTSLPFYLGNGDNGATCLHDNTGGGHASAMRAVLLPAVAKPTISSMNPVPATANQVVQITLTGKNYVAAGTSVTFAQSGVTKASIAATAVDVVTGSPNDTATFDTPATLAPGTYDVTATTASGGTSTAFSFTFSAAASPSPTPTPSATATPAPAMITVVNPNHGPTSGGTAIVLTGVNFTGVTGVTFQGRAGTAFSVVNATTINVTSPVGVSGTAFSLVLTGRAQTLNPGSDYFSYDAAVAPPTCPGDSSSRGFADVPRTSNDSHRLLFNIAHGIDPGLTVHPAASTITTGTPECDTLAGSIWSTSVVLPVMNCLPFQTGSISTFEKGWFGGNPVDEGRMQQTTAGDHTGPIGSYSGMDTDHLSDFLKSGVTLTNFRDAVAAHTPVGPLLEPDIALCPRFAILPVINVPSPPPSGNHVYPILDFKGFFLDDDPAAPGTTDHGFGFNGGSLKVVKGFAFDLDDDFGLVSNGTIGTVAYVGGPKIPVLIHDAADPAY
jgi:Flp pilus assembly protein TadG